MGGKHHGLSKTREYEVWSSMKQRCNNTRHHAYREYGGRGIKICKRWESSFLNFMYDMGEPPTTAHTLERIDNHRGYSPDNCRWATRKEQARNTRKSVFLEINGERITLIEASERFGVKKGTLWLRLKRHWPALEAVGLKPHKDRRLR